MTIEELEAQSLPIDANPEDYINLPLAEGIEKLRSRVAKGSHEPNFQHAFEICDAARSVFAAYLVEFALNGAVRYRQDILELLPGAQTVLERAIEYTRKTGGSNLAYLEEYLTHNKKRIEAVDVLHDQGREAAEELLLCDHQK